MMRASAPKNQPNPFYLARFFNIFVCQTKSINFMTFSVFSNSLVKIYFWNYYIIKVYQTKLYIFILIKTRSLVESWHVYNTCKFYENKNVILQALYLNNVAVSPLKPYSNYFLILCEYRYLEDLCNLFLFNSFQFVTRIIRILDTKMKIRLFNQQILVYCSTVHCFE